MGDVPKPMRKVTEPAITGLGGLQSTTPANQWAHTVHLRPRTSGGRMPIWLSSTGTLAKVGESAETPRPSTSPDYNTQSRRGDHRNRAHIPSKSSSTPELLGRRPIVEPTSAKRWSAKSFDFDAVFANAVLRQK